MTIEQAGTDVVVQAAPVDAAHGYGMIAPADDLNRRLLANVHPSDWHNPTPRGRYNLVVVGGGSAGLVAAAGAAGLGAKVALVERHLLGGDCLNVGCVPSKSVLRAARVVGELRRAEQFGVTVGGPVEVDFGAVMARMRRVRAEISEHDSAARFRDLGVDVYLGEGRFSGPRSFEVGGQTLHFAKALIATGSRPVAPAIPGLAEAGYLTNETFFELTELPPRVAVIGGGPIGVELAQALARLGARVTLLEKGPRLIPRDDPDAAALLADVLRADGVTLHFGAVIDGVARDRGGKTIRFTVDGRSRDVTVDAILAAAGRAPNVENLGLEAAGVAVTADGVAVDDTLVTTNPHVYAAGDVAYRYRFTHTADATARMVLQNALFPGPKRKASALIVPWTTYTDPEVAHVGLTVDEAARRGIALQTFTQPIAGTDRGRADGDEEGFVRVHVKPGSDKILGATIVARHAGEMISEITLAMATGAGLRTLGRVIHPYPTQAEAIRKVADAYNRTRLTPLVKRLFTWWLARSR